MRCKSCWLVLSCTAFLIVIGLSACQKSAQIAKKDDDAPAVDAGEDCRAGGGIYDSATNTCNCPNAGEQWTGAVCRKAANVTEEDAETLARLCEDSGGSFERADLRCTCPTDLRYDGRRCVDPDTLDQPGNEGMEEICLQAKGQWFAEYGYCDCPQDQVLDDGACKKVAGAMTELMCRRSPYPGYLNSDRCLCSDGEVFVPNMGGCSTPMRRSSPYLADVCQDSLNRGQWNQNERRCECPANKLWYEDTCISTDDLTAREMCEGDYNRGTWISGENRCQCTLGYIFAGNRCVSLQNVPEKEACESDFNRGIWDSYQNRCNCPSGKLWNSQLKTCDAEGASTAQQLCIQTGGSPASVAGRCICPYGFQTAILSPQGYEYCRASEDEVLPLWLLILLGLI